jgi:transglutaminase-like putative cysteine protease
MNAGFLKSAFVLALVAGLGNAGGAPRAESLEKYFRQTPTAADYPGAAAAVLFAHKTVLWLDAEGRLTEDIHSLTKVLNDRGREKFSEYRFFYRQDEQQVKLLRAGTYRGADDFVAVQSEDVKDFPVVAAPDAGLYGGVMVKAFQLPAAGVNTLLETRVERTTSARTDGFSGIEYFQSDEPLLEKHLQLILPRNRPLAWRVQQGDSVQQVRRAERGMDVYSFYVSGSPRIPDEPASPPLARLAARLVFSAFPDWNAAARPFAEPYWEKVRQCPRVEAFTSSLVAGSKDDREKLERIFAFVTRKVRGVPISLHLAGYAPHASDEILDKQCGDAKDKAMLAGSMLAAAGFEARPVFLNSQYLPLEEDVPALEQFDSIVLRVALPGGGTMILDPFGQADSFGWCPFAAGNRGLVIRPDGSSIEDTNLPAGEESAARNSYSIQLESDGSAQAAAEAVLQGRFAAAARGALRDLAPDETRRFFEKSARFVSRDAVLAEGRSGHLDDTGREVSLRVRFGVEGLAARQGDILVLDIPPFPLPLAEVTMYLGLESRTNPLLLGPPAASRTRTEIRLPEGAEVLYLPPDLAHTEPEWTARRTFRHDADGGTVLVEAEVGVRQQILPADAYPRAREFFSRWLDRRNNLVILRVPATVSSKAPSPGGGKGK